MGGSIAKGLLIALVFVVIPISTYSTGAAGPQTPSCGNYKVAANEVIAGVKFPKGSYQINSFGISCTKVMGSKGLFAQFLKLKDKDPLPKPWRYLADAIGAPKFSSGPGVGFRVQLITPTPTPTNEKPFSQPLAPTSFEDLPSRIDGIIYGAWLQASQQIQKSSSPLGTVNVLVGPNTNPNDAKSIDSLNLLSKLYSNSSQVKNLYVIKYSKDDIAWAQQQYELLRPNNYLASAAANYCRQSSGCIGGIAGINAASDGVILLGQGGDYGYPLEQSTMDGVVIAHEYTHTIQGINAVCRGGAGCYGDLPQWLMEGTAQWSGSVARLSVKYSDFLTFRTRDLANKYGNTSTLTSDWITTFLNPNPVFLPNQDNWSYWTKYPSDNVYSIGFMAIEILVNIKGPGAIMKMYEDVGRGQTFVQAFKQEYGIAWSDACPIIASAIAAEISRQVKS